MDSPNCEINKAFIMGSMLLLLAGAMWHAKRKEARKCRKPRRYKVRPLETTPKEDKSSILKGLGELEPTHLREETGINNDEVKFPEFISIKKDVSEKDDNYHFPELIKKEIDDGEDFFIEDEPSPFSFVKLEPESNTAEFKCFPRNMNNKDILDSSGMDLNRSNFLFLEPTKNDVKVENNTVGCKTEKTNEIMFEQWNIENEQVDIKAKDLKQSQTSMLVSCSGDEKQQNHLNKKQCDDQETQVQTMTKRLTHQIKPGQKFKCHHCDYQTLYGYCLKRHILKHKNPKDVNFFKCNLCSYQTRYKGDLKKHDLRHKNPEDISFFKCDHCDYQTIDKSSLNRHVLRHKNPDDVTMFKCNDCNFHTMDKSNLNRHLLRHKNSQDVNLFKCDYCDYRTIGKVSLNRHIFRHKNPDNMNIFKCDQCDYQTLNKSYLNSHVRRHKNPEEVISFKCDHCDYRTIYQSCLNRHMRRH